MALTPWFPGDVKPVHVGVYPRDIGGWGISYSYWNGKFWELWGLTVNDAFANCLMKSLYQNEPWRGLTEPAQQENKQ